MPTPAIVRAHVFFARGGATIDAVVVSATAKPDNDPTTNWTSLGITTELEVSPDRTIVPIYRAVSGQKVLSDELVAKADMSVNFTLQELSPFVHELIMNSGLINMAADPNPGAYVPNSRNTQIKGWIKVQFYTEQNVLVNSCDLWGSLDLSGAVSGFGVDNEEAITVPVTFHVMYSTLNAGVINNLAN